MAEVGVKELLQAGVHFGHQTRRWNPRMRRYIFGEREGIHIIDLLQTDDLLQEATDFVTEVAGKGGTILFVGTKKQARDSVEEWAEKCEMPFVNRRWLGGLLTNYHTIKQRIKRLHELRELKETGRLDLLPTKERMSMERELEKLEYNLGGVADMQRLPDAVVIIDLKTEEIALREASRLEIPIIGLVDTNCDPTPLSYVIPGNDDAIRSCDLVIRTLGEAIEGAASKWREAEAKRRAEEEERRRKEEEERKRREAEEKAKAEAEEKAKAEAEEKARAQAEEKARKEAAAKPAAKPEAKPAEKPAAKQEAKPAAKPVAKQEAKPAEKPAAKQEAKPAAKPAAKQEAKPAAKQEAKPAAKQEAKPSAKVAAEEQTSEQSAGHDQADERPAAEQAAAAGGEGEGS